MVTDLIPRYVRVNTLLWTLEQAVQHFLSVGYEEKGDPLVSRQVALFFIL